MVRIQKRRARLGKGALKVNLTSWVLITVTITYLCAVFPTAAMAAEEAILYVPGEFPTIQQAIDAARNGETIIVADGTYSGTDNRNLDFKGKAITVRSENGPENCIIDCQGEGRGFYFRNEEEDDSALSGFTIKNGSADKGAGILIDNCSPTINNCILDGNSSNGNGGGIACHLSSSTISHCVFINNSANEWGGGLHNFTSSTEITSCIFKGNSCNSTDGGGGGLANEYNSEAMVRYCTFESNNAFDDGGGLFNADSDPIISDCTFSANICGDSGGGLRNTRASPVISNCVFDKGNEGRWGGGVSNKWSSPTFENCIFKDNIGLDEGGGLHDHDADSLLQNCTFEGNWSPMGGGMGNFTETVADDTQLINCIFKDNTAESGGGGMRNWTTTAIVTDCTFEGNTAKWGAGIEMRNSSLIVTNSEFTTNIASESGGGIVNGNDSVLDAVNCTLIENQANRGGALLNSGSRATITNCIFAKNSASDGGGILNGSSSVEVINCTFQGNHSDRKGGGMYNYSCSPKITNSILWGDSPDAIFNETSSTPVVTYCDVQVEQGYYDRDVYPGSGNINEDPLLTLDYHLNPGSACIDKGDNLVVSALPTHFEGESRIFDGDGDGNATVDIGADEFSGDNGANEEAGVVQGTGTDKIIPYEPAIGENQFADTDTNASEIDNAISGQYLQNESDDTGLSLSWGIWALFGTIIVLLSVIGIVVLRAKPA